MSSTNGKISPQIDLMGCFPVVFPFINTWKIQLYYDSKRAKENQQAIIFQLILYFFLKKSQQGFIN